MPNALVTGSEGFIGKHLVPFLMAKGLDVFRVDLKSPLFSDAEHFFETHDQQFDYVFHLAAYVGGRAAISNEPLVVAKNIILDTKFWEYVDNTRPKRVLYMSSSAVYPINAQNDDHHKQLLHEDLQRLGSGTLGEPDMTYGWAKLNGEMLSQYINKRDTSVQIVRPFTGYGPGQDFTYPTSAIARRVFDREDPHVLWGPTQWRDYVYILDLIEAMWLVVNDGDGMPYNVATGEATSFDEVARYMMRLRDVQAFIEHDLSKPTGVLHRVGDPSRIKKLGWQPLVSLATGLEKTFEWVAWTLKQKEVR